MMATESARGVMKNTMSAFISNRKDARPGIKKKLQRASDDIGTMRKRRDFVLMRRARSIKNSKTPLALFHRVHMRGHSAQIHHQEQHSFSLTHFGLQIKEKMKTFVMSIFYFNITKNGKFSN